MWPSQCPANSVSNVDHVGEAALGVALKERLSAVNAHWRAGCPNRWPARAEPGNGTLRVFACLSHLPCFGETSQYPTVTIAGQSAGPVR
jgi:hypothetical protein